MKNFRVILFIGSIEILIGGLTLLSTMVSLVLGTNHKPFPILFFVLIAALTSTMIGVGILRFRRLAYRMLLYFSSVVLLSKLLILLGVIHLSGALETTVPAAVKNGFSIVYHAFVIYYLKKTDIKRIFHIWP